MYKAAGIFFNNHHFKLEAMGIKQKSLRKILQQ